jgi:hypothetical protein
MAIGLFLSGFSDQNEMYMKLVFILGFILVGAVCKLVDAYREVNKPAASEKKESSEKHAAS